MVPLWLQVLTRKVLGGRALRRTSRPAWRPRLRPRFDALETRTLMSTFNIEPLDLVAPPTSGLGDQLPVMAHPGAGARQGISMPDWSDPGWDKLLQDVVSGRPSQVGQAGSGVVPGTGGSTFVADRPREDLVSGPDRSGLRAGDPRRPSGSQVAPFVAQDVQRPRGVPGASPSPARGFKVDPVADTPAAPTRVPASPIPDVVAPPSGQVVPAPAAPQSNAAAAPSEQVAGAEAAPSRVGFSQSPGDVPDGSLLQRYVVHREEMAFAALVQRHERLVFGVCRRVLGDSHAAQDAFQATFLVLARKAGMLDRDSPLAGWLYKVAYHLALRIRALADRQRRHEKEAAYGRTEETASESVADLERQEMREALRDELQRLPEEYRTPLVLCYFDGRTHEEAARVIGLPRGSMAKRIGEGLERLRERLTDRGFML